MNTKKSLNILLGLLKEESRKIKKKKKTSPVSAPIIKRPMGSLFFMDAAVSMMESTEELQKQVYDSKDINEFLRNIITDYDLRYRNRKAAEHLVKKVSIDFVDSIKPVQKIEKDTVDDWEEIIRGGKHPFIIITDNGIDGHHKLQAYKNLGFKEVPVLFKKDLIDFYNSNKKAIKNLSESAIKPITKKFDKLKWPLNDFQKQFLEDFINIPEETLKEEDFKYASKRTGIPIESIKSIRNTYSEKLTPEQIKSEAKKIQKELGLGGGDLSQSALDKANEEFTKVRDLPKINNGKQFPINQNPGFRNMTPSETIYKMKNGSDGGLQKTFERKIPNFMYEWLMYFLEGASSVKIKDSKVMSEIHSTKDTNYKYVLFSFDNTEKLSGAHPYDVTSNKKISSLKEFEDKVLEFNETFNTNFIISNQYIGEDNEIKVVLENAQLVKDGEVAPRDMFDFLDTDREKAMRLGVFDQDGAGDISTYRSITE